MLEKFIAKLQVKNKMGLHTRPATTIVKILQHAKSDVTFTYKKDTVNAKSILSILMLAVPQNAKITVAVEGEDASQILEKLSAAFDGRFGETG
jgi:phosphocarrier protein HPr